MVWYSLVRKEIISFPLAFYLMQFRARPLGGNTSMIYRGLFTSIPLHLSGTILTAKERKAASEQKLFTWQEWSVVFTYCGAKESTGVSLRNIFFLLPKGVSVIQRHVQLSGLEIQSDQPCMSIVHLLSRVPLHRSHWRWLHQAVARFLIDLRWSPAQASFFLAGHQTLWPPVCWCCCCCGNKSVAYLQFHQQGKKTTTKT